MDPLEKRTLGHSGLLVTRVGLGGASLGGLYGDIPDEQAHEVVHRALSLGINLFDTAPLYGHGKSECRLGQALVGIPRDEYVLATKVGRLLVPADQEGPTDRLHDERPRYRAVFDFSYDAVMRSYESSLERLGVDRIDVLHIHDPYDYYDQAINEAYRALRKLREEGAIRAVSVGIGHVGLLQRFAQEGEFDCFLLSNAYNLLDQPALLELLPLCQEKGIGIMVGGTFASGILATGAKEGAKYAYRDASGDVLRRVQQMEEIAADHGASLSAAASQFVLAHPAITCIIPSTRRPERVTENVELVRQAIPRAFWEELRHEGLIPLEAPVLGDAE
jgi:D-threo-aldose 1-dehydrogenase